jgi:oligoendopeptidase F
MTDTFASLPPTAFDAMDWTWGQFEPYFHDLHARSLAADNAAVWLADWTRLTELLDEVGTRLSVATTQDTTDKEAERKYLTFLQEIAEPSEAAQQKLKEKFLKSGLEPQGFEIPLRNMRAEAEIFREANLPLLTEEQKLGNEYSRIMSTQTVQWDGQEITIPQLAPIYENPDRSVRERAWTLGAQRQLADRAAINDLWTRFMKLRGQVAANADYPDYRAYVWLEKLRFEYTPQDCVTFQDAIEAVVVPAAVRLYERRRQRLGVVTLRPWDLNVDLLGRPPLRPFQTIDELESKASAIFHHVDPALGGYFDTMRRERLLDLENRKGKRPGGYCTSFELVKLPFIFMNAVGVHDDVQTLLHEAGHCFHVFETNHLAYYPQRNVGLEFAEVASMSMELLAAPYLTDGEGGYYTPQEAARARIAHLEGIILFWPYMAVVDAFQHWVYTHHEQATDPANCDAKWAELWGRFMPGVDWSGLDDEMMTGWQRKQHIHRRPFYYVEYGLAQMGAVQVWRNALRNQAEAVAHYRRALSLGGTRPLPELFAAAGATFAFDARTLGELVALIESTIEELEKT